MEPSPRGHTAVHQSGTTKVHFSRTEVEILHSSIIPLQRIPQWVLELYILHNSEPFPRPSCCSSSTRSCCDQPNHHHAMGKSISIGAVFQSSFCTPYTSIVTASLARPCSQCWGRRR
jgi:hypothetical protein